MGSESAMANIPNHAEHVVAMGGAVQQVKTDYTSAISVQRPRALTRVVHALEEEAALSGELFYYAWGSGKNAVEGPSVKLANAAARLYGNCAVDMGPLQEMPDSWIMNAIFIDIETGFTLTRQFRQAKRWTVAGNFDEARKEDMRFQIGQSKATRNVILNALPAILIDKAMEAAKRGVRDKIQQFIKEQDQKKPGSGLPKAVEFVLGALLKLGVEEARVFNRLGIAGREAIDVDRIVSLKGDISALERQEVKAEDLYPLLTNGGASGPDTAAALRAKMEAADKAKGGKKGGKKNETAKPPEQLAEGEIPNEDFAENRDRQRDDGGEENPDSDPLTGGL